MPLHKAAEKGHIEIVELLIKSGANVNAQTDNVCSPVAWMIMWWYHHQRFCVWLSEHGCLTLLILFHLFRRCWLSGMDAIAPCSSEGTDRDCWIADQVWCKCECTDWQCMFRSEFAWLFARHFLWISSPVADWQVITVCYGWVWRFICCLFVQCLLCWYGINKRIRRHYMGQQNLDVRIQLNCWWKAEPMWMHRMEMYVFWIVESFLCVDPGMPQMLVHECRNSFSFLHFELLGNDSTTQLFVIWKYLDRIEHYCTLQHGMEVKILLNCWSSTEPMWTYRINMYVRLLLEWLLICLVLEPMNCVIDFMACFPWLFLLFVQWWYKEWNTIARCSMEGT